LQPRTPNAFRVDFEFLKKICLEKNSENFSILHSHNLLSIKHLHTTLRQTDSGQVGRVGPGGTGRTTGDGTPTQGKG
jgi:hypothetical protein